MRAAQNWTEILCAEGPARRGYHSSFMYDEKLYIHAGTDITEGALSDLWMLDLEQVKNSRSNLIDGGVLHSYDQFVIGNDSDVNWQQV